MNPSRNTIIPCIEEVKGCNALLYQINNNGTIFLEYRVKHQTWLYTHTYDIYVNVPHMSSLNSSSILKDLILQCENVEIWYTGYSIRILPLGASCPALVYTKGNRVTTMDV